MLKSTERQVFTYDLKVTKRATHATPPPLLKIAEALKSAHSTQACTHEREKGTVVYRIGDIEIDTKNDILKLLLRRCDRNAANAAYSDVKTGALDIKRKTATQGGDSAAHLVISLKEEANSPHTYLCHLEGVPGISHRLVQATLNSIIKDVAKIDATRFQYPDAAGAKVKGGGVKMHPFIPSIELLGHSSDSFRYDLENGVMTDITLVNHEEKQRFGGSPYLVEKDQFVRIAVDKSLPSNNRLQALLSALRTTSLTFEDAKIRFNDPSGITRTVSIDVTTGSPEQGLYLKSYLVKDIKPPMDASSDVLQVFLTSEMTARIRKDRK